MLLKILTFYLYKMDDYHVAIPTYINFRASDENRKIVKLVCMEYIYINDLWNYISW